MISGSEGACALILEGGDLKGDADDLDFALEAVPFKGGIDPGGRKSEPIFCSTA